MADFHAGVFDLHVHRYSGRRETPKFHGSTAVKLTVIPSLARLIGWQGLEGLVLTQRKVVA